MSARTSVVWTPDFLTYQLSDDHPLNPVRLDLHMELSRGLGVLDGVELIAPEPATDAELTEPLGEAVADQPVDRVVERSRSQPDQLVGPSRAHRLQHLVGVHRALAEQREREHREGGERGHVV